MDGQFFKFSIPVAHRIIVILSPFKSKMNIALTLPITPAPTIMNPSPTVSTASPSVATTSPSVATASPSATRVSAMADFITSVSFVDAALFLENSPEAAALGWIQNDDPLQLDARDALPTVSVRIAQRYALATIWFSSDSDWNDESNWLSEDECTWAGVQCNGGGEIIRLRMPNNGISGVIPQDIALLSVVRIIDLSGNALTGTVPLSIGNLRLLRQLYLYNNSLRGGLGRIDMTGMQALEVMDLGGNNIRGILPDSLYSMESLRILVLDDNSIRGTISPLIGSLTNLLRFTMVGNALTGEIPSEIGLLNSLGE